MNEYRYGNDSNTSFFEYATGVSGFEGGIGWSEFQAYISQGGEVDPYMTDDAHQANNSAMALGQQDIDRKALADNENIITQGLPPKLSDADILALENNIQKLQNDIDRPGSDSGYVPPVVPDSTPPVYSSLTATVTRQEGWQGALGFIFRLDGYDAGFVPGNLAMAVYSGAGCDGYLYTTGAFQQDAIGWFAECPAGQEPGDVDIHFGMLEGSLSISCFTLVQGVQEKIFNVYV